MKRCVEQKTLVGLLMCALALQIKGTTRLAWAWIALDENAMRMTRFVAPVTMLATGGAGQVILSHPALKS